MMLSAIAARKAAVQVSSKPTSPSPPSRSPLLQSMGTSNTGDKLTSKRKPHVLANPGPSKNKKAKVHAPTKPDRVVRYFDPRATSNAQNETLVDDSTCRIEVSSEPDSSSGSEVEMEMNVPPPVGLSSISITKTERGWSPSRPIPNSSDDDEPAPSNSFDPATYLIPSTSIKPEPFSLSAFRPVLDYNVYSAPENEYTSSGKAWILVLQPGETLALVGTYSFYVLQGSLSLLGVTLSPSNAKYTVFAPRSSPIPILSWATLDRQGSCTFPIPQAIQQQVNTTAILIECANTGVEGLGRICKVFENMFKPPRGSVAIPGVDPPRIHIVNHGAKDIRPFVLPSSWEVAFASITEKSDSEMSSVPVCLVKGCKKSGKSTLARTLVNRLLSRYRRVAFLECDLGQSEFTPGGLVALNLVENYIFGPPFTHPSLPYRAHYIGSTSPRANPSHYLHSIRSLFETYKLELQFPVSIDVCPPGDERIYDDVPLVVNTMGWNKGLGADLNARIEEFVAASHTFYVDGAEEKGWPAPLQLQHVPQFSTVLPFMRTNIRRCIKVEAIPMEMMNVYHTSTDHRHLNMLSYFHATFPELQISSSGSALKQVTATSWDTSLPLCWRYPYEVDYTVAFDHVYLTGPGYEDVVPSELTRVLNGAIVGLVSDGLAKTFSQQTQSTSHEKPSLSYTPGEPPPDPGLSMCHGLALIRGVPRSLNSPHMHILTPLPTALLSQTRVLVKGEMELPVWGMLDFREDEEGQVAGVEKGHVPYLQWGKGEGIGSEKRRVRRNLMRKGQR